MNSQDTIDNPSSIADPGASSKLKSPPRSASSSAISEKPKSDNNHEVANDEVALVENEKSDNNGNKASNSKASHAIADAETLEQYHRESKNLQEFLEPLDVGWWFIGLHNFDGQWTLGVTLKDTNQIIQRPEPITKLPVKFISGNLVGFGPGIGDEDDDDEGRKTTLIMDIEDESRVWSWDLDLLLYSLKTHFHLFFFFFFFRVQRLQFTIL